jgi:hypothetical protein
MEGCTQQQLAVEPTEEDARSVVAGIRPHSRLPALACHLILEISLDVVAGLEPRYASPGNPGPE